MKESGDIQRILHTVMGLRKSRRQEHDGVGRAYASFQRRLLANVVDTFLLLILLAPVIDYIVTATFGEVTLDMQALQEQARREPDKEQAARLMADVFREARMPERWTLTIMLQVFFFALFTQVFWHFYAATPGKLLLRMRIVDDRSGQPINDFQGMMRFIGYAVSFAPVLLGFLWIGFDRKRQGWHDKLAGTVVVVIPRVKEQVTSGSESADLSNSPAPAKEE